MGTANKLFNQIMNNAPKHIQELAKKHGWESSGNTDLSVVVASATGGGPLGEAAIDGKPVGVHYDWKSWLLPVGGLVAALWGLPKLFRAVFSKKKRR